MSISTQSKDDRYDMLVLISEDDYNDCIAGDPDEEGDWEPVINQATDTEYWRYKPAKPYLNESGERLSDEEHADKYKMSLDVIGFVECCYSPKWSEGFNYYPLWEACVSDGSIDGDEIDVDQLSQMIKDRKYWMGANGGYVIPSKESGGYKVIVKSELVTKQFTQALLKIREEQGWDVFLQLKDKPEYFVETVEQVVDETVEHFNSDAEALKYFQDSVKNLWDEDDNVTMMNPQGSIIAQTFAVATIQIKGSHICITGQLTKTRKEYEEAIEAAGGINAKSVTKTTDILVCNLDHSSKKDKASELGIPIITEDQLTALLDSAS